MRKIIALFVFVSSFINMPAQVEGGEIGEVTVSGSRVVEKHDRLWIFPSAVELKSSSNGYSLLNKLTLPGIRVDVSGHSISSIDNRGDIAVLINDIPATHQDIMSLDIDAVARVEFVESPGLRYGEGMAHVINIMVKRARSGYTTGADLNHDLVLRGFDDNVFARINNGKSEFGMSYAFGYADMRGYMSKETADYTLNDGSVKHVTRQDVKNVSRSANHSAQLSYSLSDTAYILQARLEYDREKGRSFRERIVDNAVGLCNSRSLLNTHRPAIDLYFHRDLKRHQTITASVALANINSDGCNNDNEVTPYVYDIDGRVWSLQCEAVYENVLKPFTFDMGMQYRQKLTDNRYGGDVSARSLFRSSDKYMYGQISGKLARLQYTVGMGASSRYYRQGRHSNSHFVLRPKFDASYSLGRGWRLKYSFERSQKMSSIAVINDVSVRTNSMEMVVGNPDLKPNSVLEHVLRLTMNKPRLALMLQGYVKLNPLSNLRHTTRTEENIFIDTQLNQPHCNFFMVMAYARYDVIPQRLVVSMNGNVYHCDNKGIDYRHRYTSFMGVASVDAYLGKWTVTAYADTGFRWMEGETRGRNGAEIQLVAAYRAGPLTLSLNCRNPLFAHPETHRAEQMNANLHKITTIRDGDAGNYVRLDVSLKLRHGRTYRDIRRTINLKDRDAGILK